MDCHNIVKSIHLILRPPPHLPKHQGLVIHSRSPNVVCGDNISKCGISVQVGIVEASRPIFTKLGQAVLLSGVGEGGMGMIHGE